MNFFYSAAGISKNPNELEEEIGWFERISAALNSAEWGRLELTWLRVVVTGGSKKAVFCSNESEKGKLRKEGKLKKEK